MVREEGYSLSLYEKTNITGPLHSSCNRRSASCLPTPNRPTPLHCARPAGFKLGHTIPWVSGFPFNVVRHPQYVGSVATVWGAAALLWQQAPSGLGLVAGYLSALYAITGWMES